MATAPLPDSHHDPLDGWSLPAWTYSDPDFYAAEMERVFRPTWQIVCHDNDIPNAGDWHSSIIAARASSSCAEPTASCAPSPMSAATAARGWSTGHTGCAKKLACPYHAWTYALDGRLIGVPDRQVIRRSIAARRGLVPVESRTMARLPVRAPDDDGGPSVAAMMAPYEAMVAPYRFEELRRLGRVTLRPREVNWKNVADNYSDGLHITVAHPGLTRLFGKSYGIEAEEHVDRMSGDLIDRPSANRSERAYQRLLPPVPHLPQDKQRRWLYFKLWPNVAFDIYPDQVDFMHFLPVGPTDTPDPRDQLCLPDARREMKAARYLNWRINRRVNAEDTTLITRVQQGMASQSFTMGPLSDKEVCLKHFCSRMRDLIPEARQEHAPVAGWSKT